MLAATRFEEMTYPEVQEYLEFSQREYAQGMFDQGEYPDYETALRAGRSEINHYYRTTQEGESHYTYHIVNAQTGKRVGMLAFSILLHRGDNIEPFVFIDYITVFPDARRQGHAKRAMQFVEKWALEHDLHQIDLNVMKHKKGAYGLYLGLGYEVYRERALGFAKEPGRFDMRKRF